MSITGYQKLPHEVTVMSNCDCKHGNHKPGCRGFAEHTLIDADQHKRSPSGYGWHGSQVRKELDACDGRFGCAKLDSKGNCGCSNDANQSKQEHIAKEHLRLYNEWLKHNNKMEPNAKVEFCEHCGASIPHRHGEGRCIECFHHAPREEWGNFEKLVRGGRDGRAPLQEPVPGTALLRKTLEALEHLLRRDTCGYRHDTCGYWYGMDELKSLREKLDAEQQGGAPLTMGEMFRLNELQSIYAEVPKKGQ